MHMQRRTTVMMGMNNFQMTQTIQDTEMNDQISPSSDRGTESDPRNNWHQGHGAGYGHHATGTTGFYRFLK